MARPDWLDLFNPHRETISRKASEHGLDPDLLTAICMKESRGDNWAIRFEAHWSHFHFPRAHAERLEISAATEEALQKFSFGLGQVMGAVARQHGYKGDLIRICADPELALELACRHLKWLRVRCQEEADLIASYNGGWGALRKTPGGQYPNFRYVDAVSAYLHELRRLD
jgi:hypothetical protein